MDSLIAFVPMDRRLALLEGRSLPDRTEGAALFADISGFTPLTEALVRELGPLRGAEELTRHLNLVYDALINELHCFRGSVIGFSGDAITCWFDGDDGSRAAACGLFMQMAMQSLASVSISPENTVTLAMKAAVATGRARRFLVGDPGIQVIEAVAGKTLDHLAAAEHHTQKGEVVLDASTITALGDRAHYRSWRVDEQTGLKFGVLEGLKDHVEMDPWPPVNADQLDEGLVRQWLLPPVYERLRGGQVELLAEFRPAVSLFVRFGGIDYDNDDQAGEKLDVYIRKVQAVLHRYEGSLIQLTMGDKGSYLQAAFGAPIAHEDDVMRTVSAATEIVRISPSEAWNSSVQIGIARGRMRTGAYGGSMRRTYGVLSDEVNLAARLMQAASPGQILVSDRIYAASDETFDWEELPPLSLKGKSAPVVVYSLRGIRERTAIRLQAPKYALPMVGRKVEIDLIGQKMATALQGKGQIAGITGEAGMGKSRLVAEVIELANEHDFTGFGGECQSYGTNTSYLVWQNIWKGFFGLDPQLSLEDKLELLESHLAQIDPKSVGRLPLLGPVLNLSIPDNDLTRNLDAKLRKSSLEALLLDCLRERAKSSPIFLVLEDCHWLDPLSHDLLELLARAVGDLPVFILMAYRPFDAQHWKDTRISHLAHFTEIGLSEFSHDEARQLIGLKLKNYLDESTTVQPELVDHITNRAEGNPFYIEELINYLQDQGIDPNDQEAMKKLDLPSSLHSLILTRIDQRTESQKVTIKLASVIGRMFAAAWLWGAFPELGDPSKIITDLDELSKLDLTPLDSQDPEYIYLFKHIVTREVAYESLPYATRALLHDQLAQFIEVNLADSPEQIDLLAYHYFEGRAWSKAMDYNLQAAKDDLGNYANESAIVAYKRSLEAAAQISDGRDTAPQRTEAYTSLGKVLTLVGRYDEALEQFEAARSLVESQPSSARQQFDLADLCRRTAYVYERFSEYDLAFEWLERGLSHLDENEPSIHAALIFLLGAGLYHRQGESEKAVRWCQRSQDTAAHIDTREAQQALARSHYLLGAIYMRAGDLSAALQHCQKSIQIYQEIDDFAGQARAYNYLANAFSNQGDWDHASEAYNKSLEITQQVGDIQEQGFIANNLGLIHLDRGEWDQAQTLFEQSNAIWRQLGAALPEAVTLSNLAQVFIYRGELERARENLIESQRLFETVGSEYYLPELERRWGEYYSKSGNLERALDHVQRSLQLAEEQEVLLEEGLSARLLGQIYLSMQDLRRAEAYLTRGLKIFDKMESEFEAARTVLALVDLALVSKKPRIYPGHIASAIETFNKLGARPELEKALQLKALLERPS